MDMYQKIAYLKGLADGLELAQESKEGKMISKIIDVLEEMADSIEELYDAQDEVYEYCEAIDEDLTDLEELLDAECDCDCDCDCDEDECYCGMDEDYLEVECPDCGETVCFYDEMFGDAETVEVLCPNCDAVVYTIEDELVEDVEQLHKKSPNRNNNPIRAFVLYIFKLNANYTN